ncbi:MAG: hypothetical protein R3B84_21780 [Zavarzinella sp.]
MPIPFTCVCGKTRNLKDEFAGKRIRCPDCHAVSEVPYVIEREEYLVDMDDVVDEPVPTHASNSSSEDADDLAARALMDDDDDNNTSRQSWAEPQPYSQPTSRPTIDPSRYYREEIKQAEQERRARQRPERPPVDRWNGNTVTGLLMMLGAVVWFGLGFAAGRIFIYPPILFILGLVSFFKGFSGDAGD